MANKQYKKGKYADDTFLFLDGTEKTLKMCLEKLENFSLSSGLKISTQKTQEVWIGNRNKTKNEIIYM